MGSNSSRGHDDTVDLTWKDLAACKPAPKSVFYPTTSNAVTLYKQAKANYCDQCPVASECLEYAIAHRINTGMWGGKTEEERNRLIRVRAYQRRRELANA